MCKPKNGRSYPRQHEIKFIESFYTNGDKYMLLIGPVRVNIKINKKGHQANPISFPLADNGKWRSKSAKGNCNPLTDQECYALSAPSFSGSLFGLPFSLFFQPQFIFLVSSASPR